MKISKINIYWVVLRLVMGFTFLWAFLDKLFGLGFSTPSKMSWLNGTSPTSGFLKSLNGPFSGIFNALSSQPVVDWLFMIGLLSIGLCLILGLFLKPASIAGILMMSLMWLALFPSKTNPLIDDHIVYIFVLIGFLIYEPSKYLSIDYLLRNKKDGSTI
jgi:thiosulfate dehydrogenase [quinone] large subunit